VETVEDIQLQVTYFQFFLQIQNTASITEKKIDNQLFFYNRLAREPSVAQVTHSYPSRLPALGLKLRF